ncbi:MAG: excinuclease ABC subunit A, partial [Deltaproteobacteria bacterium]|nr:excinuclease ABC subunit A [Deltaproteobacteria bacterium]
MSAQHIVIKGAREHNLKNIDLALPRNSLIVITGVSGSGKSTLAFDTIYAEGQRRYVESLSAYARQFLELMDKPDVDFIEGLSPAIAIEQRKSGQNPRSTVATSTEIYDYLRLLFARLGVPYCYQCGQPIASQSVPLMVEQIMTLPEGSRLSVLAPVVVNKKGEHQKLLQRLRQEGYSRIRLNGELLDLDEPVTLDKNKRHTIEVLVDRLVVKPGLETRLTDSLELAVGLSDGVVKITLLDGSEMLFSERFACETCGISYPELTPQMFSFNSPQGACATCSGLGTQLVLDPDMVAPDPDLSIREGAILPWAHRQSMYHQQMLEALEQHYDFAIRTPFKELSPEVQQVLLYGSGQESINFFYERNGRRLVEQRTFEGVIPNLQRRYQETDSALIREEIERFMTRQPCPDCQGGRLRREALAVRLNGHNISEITQLTVGQCHAWFAGLTLTPHQEAVGRRVLKEITERLSFLLDVGLDYLTLNRTTASLSGGEGQRIRLATQIGSKLTGVLYVLDEPSIGLHQRDNLQLLRTLKTLRDLGNTVIVVEHDPETINSADFVVDMGPGAGNQGGEVVFSGTSGELAA